MGAGGAGPGPWVGGRQVTRHVRGQGASVSECGVCCRARSQGRALGFRILETRGVTPLTHTHDRTRTLTLTCKRPTCECRDVSGEDAREAVSSDVLFREAGRRRRALDVAGAWLSGVSFQVVCPPTRFTSQCPLHTQGQAGRPSENLTASDCIPQPRHTQKNRRPRRARHLHARVPGRLVHNSQKPERA